MGQTLIPVLWLSTDGAYVAAVVSADAFLFSQGCGSVCAAPTLGRGQKLQHQSLCFIFLLVRSQHHSTKVDGKHQMCDTHVSSMCRMDAGAAPGRKQHMLPPGAQSSAPVLTSCSSWLHLTLRSHCSNQKHTQGLRPDCFLLEGVVPHTCSSALAADAGLQRRTHLQCC